MNADLQRIFQSKEAERRRLRALPWPEKVEMLDRLRERHLALQRMQPRPVEPLRSVESRDRVSG